MSQSGPALWKDRKNPAKKEAVMIPYRPIPPLTAGPRKGWASVLAAVVMAALLGIQPR